MSQSKNKSLRYQALIKRTKNWPAYLWKKVTGFGPGFEFDLHDFGRINVPRNMLGAFRENFFDDIYFRHLPDAVFSKQAPLIIDIGANVGYFSLATFSKYPKARILAFEPHPFCFKVLNDYRQTFSDFNWEINQAAVSSKEGSMTLYTDSVDDFTTVSGTHHADGASSVEVPTIKLDDFLAKTTDQPIDLIKLDCEGAEYDILYALSPDFFESVKTLSIETHRSDQPKHDIASLAAYLEQVGYQVQALDEGGTGYIWAVR